MVKLIATDIAVHAHAPVQRVGQYGERPMPRTTGTLSLKE